MQIVSNRAARIAAFAVLAAVFLAIALAPGAVRAQEESGLISLQAENTSVMEILDILADRSGLNIVAGANVQDRPITIRLRETPFEEALRLVVRAAGLGYERSGSTILVADIQTLNSPTGLDTRVYKLQYANAASIRSAIEIITRDVAHDEKHSMVTVRGTPAQLEQASHIVDAMDTRPRQIQLEARLVEINTSKLEEIGIDWEKITKYTTIVTEGPADPGPLGSMPEELAFTKIDDGSNLYRQNAAFEVTVEAMLTNDTAKILSNSNLVTLDGESAEIFAGDTVPVVITSLQSPGSAGGSLQTVQLEKIDVGVRLNITPRLTEDGYITALVEPEVSRIVRFVGPDADLPQTSTRRARTLVRVRDGEKIYLGGLLTDEERKTVKKVPLLGDIPLLGYLFRHTKTQIDKLDLLIEITPHIIDDGDNAITIEGSLAAEIADEGK